MPPKKKKTSYEQRKRIYELTNELKGVVDQMKGAHAGKLRSLWPKAVSLYESIYPHLDSASTHDGFITPRYTISAINHFFEAINEEGPKLHYPDFEAISKGDPLIRASGWYRANWFERQGRVTPDPYEDVIQDPEADGPNYITPTPTPTPAPNSRPPPSPSTSTPSYTLRNRTRTRTISATPEGQPKKLRGRKPNPTPWDVIVIADSDVDRTPAPEAGAQSVSVAVSAPTGGARGKKMRRGVKGGKKVRGKKLEKEREEKEKEAAMLAESTTLPASANAPATRKRKAEKTLWEYEPNEKGELELVGSSDEDAGPSKHVKRKKNEEKVLWEYEPNEKGELELVGSSDEEVGPSSANKAQAKRRRREREKLELGGSSDEDAIGGGTIWVRPKQQTQDAKEKQNVKAKEKEKAKDKGKGKAKDTVSGKGKAKARFAPPEDDDDYEDAEEEEIDQLASSSSSPSHSPSPTLPPRDPSIVEVGWNHPDADDIVLLGASSSRGAKAKGKGKGKPRKKGRISTNPEDVITIYEEAVLNVPRDYDASNPIDVDADVEGGETLSAGDVGVVTAPRDDVEQREEEEVRELIEDTLPAERRDVEMEAEKVASPSAFEEEIQARPALEQDDEDSQVPGGDVIMGEESEEERRYEVAAAAVVREDTQRSQVESGEGVDAAADVGDAGDPLERVSVTVERQDSANAPIPEKSTLSPQNPSARNTEAETVVPDVRAQAQEEMRDLTPNSDMVGAGDSGSTVDGDPQPNGGLPSMDVDVDLSSSLSEEVIPTVPQPRLDSPHPEVTKHNLDSSKKQADHSSNESASPHTAVDVISQNLGPRLSTPDESTRDQLVVSDLDSNEAHRSLEEPVLSQEKLDTNGIVVSDTNDTGVNTNMAIDDLPEKASLEEEEASSRQSDDTLELDRNGSVSGNEEVGGALSGNEGVTANNAIIDGGEDASNTVNGATHSDRGDTSVGHEPRPIAEVKTESLSLSCAPSPAVPPTSNDGPHPASSTTTRKDTNPPPRPSSFIPNKTPIVPKQDAQVTLTKDTRFFASSSSTTYTNVEPYYKYDSSRTMGVQCARCVLEKAICVNVTGMGPCDRCTWHKMQCSFAAPKGAISYGDLSPLKRRLELLTGAPALSGYNKRVKSSDNGSASVVVSGGTPYSDRTAVFASVLQPPANATLSSSAQYSSNSSVASTSTAPIPQVNHGRSSTLNAASQAAYYTPSVVSSSTAPIPQVAIPNTAQNGPSQTAHYTRSNSLASTSTAPTPQVNPILTSMPAPTPTKSYYRNIQPATQPDTVKPETVASTSKPSSPPRKQHARKSTGKWSGAPRYTRVYRPQVLPCRSNAGNTDSNRAGVAAFEAAVTPSILRKQYDLLEATNGLGSRHILPSRSEPSPSPAPTASSSGSSEGSSADDAAPEATIMSHPAMQPHPVASSSSETGSNNVAVAAPAVVPPPPSVQSHPVSINSPASSTSGNSRVATTESPVVPPYLATQPQPNPTVPLYPIVTGQVPVVSLYGHPVIQYTPPSSAGTVGSNGASPPVIPQQPPVFPQFSSPGAIAPNGSGGIPAPAVPHFGPPDASHAQYASPIAAGPNGAGAIPANGTVSPGANSLDQALTYRTTPQPAPNSSRLSVDDHPNAQAGSSRASSASLLPVLPVQDELTRSPSSASGAKSGNSAVDGAERKERYALRLSPPFTQPCASSVASVDNKEVVNPVASSREASQGHKSGLASTSSSKRSRSSSTSRQVSRQPTLPPVAEVPVSMDVDMGNTPTSPPVPTLSSNVISDMTQQLSSLRAEFTSYKEQKHNDIENVNRRVDKMQSSLEGLASTLAVILDKVGDIAGPAPPSAPIVVREVEVQVSDSLEGEEKIEEVPMRVDASMQTDTRPKRPLVSILEAFRANGQIAIDDDDDDSDIDIDFQYPE